MFVTYSGIEVDQAFVKFDQVNLIDIAHHLTMINRFGGALNFDQHYSVAEHSCLLAQYILDEFQDEEAAKYALMHDASEAYLGDVVSGLKAYLPEYKRLENKLEFMIREKYGIRLAYANFVSALDKRIMLDEVLALCPHRYQLYKVQGISPLGIKNLAINDGDYGQYRPGTVPKDVVYNEFLWMCDYLGIGD